MYYFFKEEEKSNLLFGDRASYGSTAHEANIDLGAPEIARSGIKFCYTN